VTIHLQPFYEVMANESTGARYQNPCLVPHFVHSP
jgi:hypothetical protein